MTLKQLLLATVLSTATLFAGFTNIDCDNQTHLNTLKITQGDCLALESFWDVTNPQNWNDKTAWDTLVSSEDWYGVTLHENDFGIKYFVMRNNNLTGNIPDEIELFTNLFTIGLGENNFSNSIPESIKNISSLQAIFFDRNNFSGNLPKLTGLSNLTRIVLFGNNYSGSVPIEWSTLSSLEKVSIYNNNLSGSLPNLSNLTKLDKLNLVFNKFDFKDIEPQISWLKTIPSVNYSKQGDYRDYGVTDSCADYYTDESNRIVYFDKELNIAPSIAINDSGNDNYIWYKHSYGLVADNGKRIFTKEDAIPSDAGYYYYIANNSIVTHKLYSSYMTNLHICGTRGEDGIQAIHDNTPDINNTNPTLNITEGELYTYNSDISDEDNDPLSATLNSQIDGLTFMSDASSFSLTGTPPLGSYDINITVTDGKIPIHINYILHVNPSEASLPTGFSFLNGTYTHTTTGNTLSGEGSVNVVNDGLELTQSCIDNKQAYISIASDGELTTGFTDCSGNNPSNTFIDPLPNKTKASIVTNNAEKMILIELPLGDDMTLGGN